MYRFIALAAVVAAIVAPAGSTAPDRVAATCQGAVTWSSAKAFVGRVATIKGPVVDAYYARSSNGSPTFLNLGRTYPNPTRFTVVIWSENRARFGAPERRYRGRTVCVRGRVTLYRGSPQIEAEVPTQIAIAR